MSILVKPYSADFMKIVSSKVHVLYDYLSYNDGIFLIWIWLLTDLSTHIFYTPIPFPHLWPIKKFIFISLSVLQFSHISRENNWRANDENIRNGVNSNRNRLNRKVEKKRSNIISFVYISGYYYLRCSTTEKWSSDCSDFGELRVSLMMPMLMSNPTTLSKNIESISRNGLHIDHIVRGSIRYDINTILTKKYPQQQQQQHQKQQQKRQR